MPFGWVAAAGAVGAIGSAVIGSNAAQSAASTEAGAANNATQLQQNEFNTVQGEYAPQRNLGYGADSLLSQLYGIQNPNTAPSSATGGPAAGSTYLAPGGAAPNYSGFENSPGYQFSVQQGQNAINRQATASGNLYSANTLAQLSSYNTGAASTEYNNYVQQLMGIAGLGGQATAGTAAAATTTGNNESQDALIGGAANASGVLGSASAINGGLSSLTNPNYLNSLLSNYNGGGINLNNPGAVAGFSNNLTQSQLPAVPVITGD